MRACWNLTILKDGDGMKKAIILLLSVFAGSVAVYWWNLDNKLLFYAIRPILNRHYDSQERDIRL